MLECNKCHEAKAESEFNWNSSKNRYENHCKLCHSNYLKAHYANNKQYYKDKSQHRRAEIRQWLRNYKSLMCCKKCNENHVACLEFHHRDPKQKEVNVAAVINKCWCIARIEKEVAKCIVLCSNCHRKLHWEQKHN